MRRVLSVACAAAIFFLPLVFFYFFGAFWLSIMLAVPVLINTLFWVSCEVVNQGGGFFFPFMWKQILALPFLLGVFFRKHLVKAVVKRFCIVVFWIFLTPKVRRYYKRWQRFVRFHVNRVKHALNNPEKTVVGRVLYIVILSAVLTSVLSLVSGILIVCVEVSDEILRVLKWVVSFFGDFNFKWLATRGWWISISKVFQKLPGKASETYNEKKEQLFRRGIRRRKRIATAIRLFVESEQRRRHNRSRVSARSLRYY